MAYAGRVTTPEAEHNQSDRIEADDARPQDAGDPQSAAPASPTAAADAAPENGTTQHTGAESLSAGSEGAAQVGAEGVSQESADVQSAGGPSMASDGSGSEGDAPQGEARPEARLERAVRAAEQALIEFEIAVETFRVEVENFSRLHHQKLGPMYSRLDELDAQIAEAQAARTGDPEDIRKADEARARVMPMPGVEELFHGWMDSEGLFPEALAMLTDQPVRPPQRVRPSDEARKLYRELARKAHPDLAQDEDERRRRDEFISRVNAAYARGDEALLRELSEEWAAGPVPKEWKPSRSEELYARLEWLSERKEMLTLVAHELEESAIGAMLKLAPEDPDRLLDEIAEQLLAQVGERETELARLVG